MWQQVTVLTNESLNHSFNRFIKNADSFWNDVHWLNRGKQTILTILCLKQNYKCMNINKHSCLLK